MYKYRYITARGKDAKKQQQLLPSTDPSSVSASAPVSVSKVAKEQPRKSHGSVIIPSSLLKDDEFGEIIHEGSNACYKYRDLANVPEKDLDDQSQESPPAAGRTRGSTESIRVQKFPLKLYAILAQKEFQEIISWMPHGRSWRVHKPSLFETRVMPLFFEYSNYHSFNRLINAWSFRRVTSGIDRGSYYHELFLRGKPYLHKFMRRLPKAHKKLPMRKEDEPNFDAIDKKSPLPSSSAGVDNDAVDDGLFRSERNQSMRSNANDNTTNNTNTNADRTTLPQAIDSRSVTGFTPRDLGAMNSIVGATRLGLGTTSSMGYGTIGYETRMGVIGMNTSPTTRGGRLDIEAAMSLRGMLTNSGLRHVGGRPGDSSRVLDHFNRDFPRLDQLYQEITSRIKPNEER